MKIILAENDRAAQNFCNEHGFERGAVIMVRSIRTLEGLRFCYEDVIRVPGWSNRPDIEEIEDRILRTNITMSRCQICQDFCQI